MKGSTSPAQREFVDGVVSAFEAARARDPRADLAGYLPPPGHPHYHAAARELVRVDLEFGWSEGNPRPLNEYRTRYPEVFADAAAVRDIAFEEFRQKVERGEDADPAEYARRYHIDTAGWPAAGRNSVPGGSTTARDSRAAGVVQAYRHHLAGEGLSQATAEVDGIEVDVLDLLREVHRGDEGGFRPTENPLDVPAVGSEFLGFRLEEELGRGAFGRVFLARQPDVANRQVALKIAIDLHGETQRLGQLQHTNIVPVYSVHRHGVLQAICMPYFGATTLTDVIRGIRGDRPLPDSGKQLVSTLNDRKSRTQARPSSQPSSAQGPDSAGSSPAADSSPALPAVGPRPAGAAVSLERLEALSYVEAVLSLTARLADGLAHAHDRGIVHRDLKPANVLLTDEGEPMILDFNLSEDSKLRSNPGAARMGGTLPYMSPEQLEAFDRKGGPVDGRSDVYSLGVIAFELLTGRFPFPRRGGPARRCVAEMLEDRRGPVPGLRVLNPALSPAVESIVRKCLDPDPARRYQSARDLREDLERQLADRPLRHAPEPSLRERAGKWVRRHPRLSSSTTVAAVAVAVLLACAAGGAAAWRKHQADLAAARAEQSRTAALESWSQLRQVREVQQALANYPDRASVRQVIDLSRESLRAYSLPENPDWETAPELAHLAEEERDGLRRTLAAVLAGWSDAEREWAETEPDAGARREHLETAWRLNERAESVLGGRAGQALLRQQARLAELLGRPEAAGLARRASDTPPHSADDHFQLARELLRKREVKQAAPHLAEATRLDPRHFWAWFFLGNCRRELTQTDEAVACYSACAAVAPDGSLAYFPYLNRGTAYASQGKHAEAEADLARAVRALESLPESLRRRERAKPHVATARLRTRDRDYAAAEDLLTRALDAGAADPRLLFERAKVRRLRGDADGARQDLEAGLRSRPENEADWNDRGLARLDAAPRGLFRALAAQANALAALRDFDEALRLNPVYHTALQNKAAVLSERLGREREALDVLDNLIALYPGYVPARIGRAVVLARHGKRAEALADVRESLARDRSPVTLYQSANVFALTSRTTPADADRVVPLLGAALWGGFGLDVVDRDSDMDAVRNRADFRRVVDVVRELSGDQLRP